MAITISMPASATIAMQQATQGAIPAAGDKMPAVSDKMKDSAKDFEAVFLSEMLSHMFEGTEPDKMFGGGSGEKMFQGMMVQEYGKMMANGQGIGISQQIQKLMMQMQEHQSTKSQ